MAPVEVDFAEAATLLPRFFWGGGMPPPYSVDWLYYFACAIIFFFPSLALVIVALRIYGRVKLQLFGWDDVLIIIAMIFGIGFTATTFMYMITNYSAIHIWDIPPHDFMPGRKWDFANQIIYNPVLALVKCSALLFLLRLGGTKRGVRYFIHFLNFINIGLMIAIFFVLIFTCQPIAYRWDESIPGGKCINTAPFNISTAIINIVTDVLVLTIPFWIVWHLKMPGKVKMALLGVFLLGLIVTAASIVRLWLLAQMLHDIAHRVFTPDPTYSVALTSSSIEGNLAIIAASIPTLWPLARHWFPNFFARLASSGLGGSGEMRVSPDMADKQVLTVGGSDRHTYDAEGRATSPITKPAKSFGRHFEVGRGGNSSGSEEDTYDGALRGMLAHNNYDDRPISKFGPYRSARQEGEKDLMTKLGEPDIRRAGPRE